MTIDTDQITDPVDEVEGDTAIAEPEDQVAEGDQTGADGEQGAMEESPEDATPVADQVSDKSTVAAPKEGSDPLLESLPDTFRDQILEMREKLKNYDKRGAEWQREHQARLEAERQIQRYKEIHPDPNELRSKLDEVRKYQEAIEAKPPWHPMHPHHKSFMELARNGNEIANRVQEIRMDAEIDPETKARLVRREQERLTQQDWDHLRAFRQAQDAWMVNPSGQTVELVEQYVPQIVRQEIDRRFMEINAQKEVQEFVKAHPESVVREAGLLQSVLSAPQQGKQFEIAKTLLEMKERLSSLESENNSLKAKLGSAATKVVTAEAQIEATSRKATRTPVGTSAGSLFDSEDLAKALREGTLVDRLTSVG